MLSGLPILILATAQSASVAAAASPTESGSAGTAQSSENVPCETPYPGDGDDEVVICVERQQGYRIDPDILKAEKEKKRQKRKRPERFVDKSCASVGPMGCGPTAGINVIAAALTAAEMAKRAAKGENVGEMFITDPQPDEYQLYKEAKRQREAKRAADAEELKQATEAKGAEAETAATPK